MRAEEIWVWERPSVPIDEHVPDGTQILDEDDVDVIGESFGLTYRADEILKFGEKEHQRDVHRWELNPASSEDYRTRT